MYSPELLQNALQLGCKSASIAADDDLLKRQRCFSGDHMSAVSPRPAYRWVAGHASAWAGRPTTGARDSGPSSEQCASSGFVARFYGIDNMPFWFGRSDKRSLGPAFLFGTWLLIRSLTIICHPTSQSPAIFGHYGMNEFVLRLPSAFFWGGLLRCVVPDRSHSRWLEGWSRRRAAAGVVPRCRSSTGQEGTVLHLCHPHDGDWISRSG